MNGDIWLGPNAVLALDREGYKLTSFSLKDCLEIARFKGMTHHNDSLMTH